jgi:hypothetical protein
MIIKIECVKEINISLDKIEKQYKYYKLNKDYLNRISLRRIHNTTMSVVKIYNGFPIFFINSIDYSIGKRDN